MITEAGEIINSITSIFSNIKIGNLDVITLGIFVLCIGWVIHSLANKEP